VNTTMPQQPSASAHCSGEKTSLRSQWPGASRGSAATFALLAARWVLLLLFITSILPTVQAQPATGDREFTQADLNIGFARQAFSGVNRNDVEAAFKAFLVTVGRRQGFDLAVRSQVFDDAPSFEAAIRGVKVHIAIISAWDYVVMDLSGFADPSFVAVDQRGALSEYIVLSRRDGGPRSLVDLRGKSMTLLENSTTYASAPWVDTLLLENGLGMPGTFFGSVETVTKPSGAVLPVFFGNRTACVVDRAAFDTMNELNPQIGQRLQTMIVSPPLLNAVVCVSRSGWISPEHREAAIRGMVNLDEEPQGRQILTLFKVREMIPFKPEYLTSVQKLRAEHDRLKEAAKRDAPGSIQPFSHGNNAP